MLFRSGLPISAAAAVLEEIHKSGCNGGACHAQMYIMGTVLRHGSPEQKQKFLPKIDRQTKIGVLVHSVSFCIPRSDTNINFQPLICFHFW